MAAATCLMHLVAIITSATTTPTRGPHPRLRNLGPARPGASRCQHCNCEVKNLARHYKLCPKLREIEEMQALPFYRANCNLGASEVTAVGAADLLPIDPAFVERVRLAHSQVVEPACKDTSLVLDGMGDLESASVREAERQRHLAQCASIVSQLEALDAIGRGHAHFELGAGSAGVALALASTVRFGQGGDSIVLLDQFMPRKKADKHLREMGAPFERYKIGLEHLDLTALRAHCGAQRPVSVVGKHLCGVASDFAVRAVAGTAGRVDALVLSTCCHHRCSYGPYPNRAFLESIGFHSEAEFRALCRMSSWAVDGASGSTSGAQWADGTDRREVGRMCKALLDTGRVRYLRAHGYACWRAEYIEDALTPENVVIVAHSLQADRSSS